VEREVLGARPVRKQVALREFSGIALRAELVGDGSDELAVSVNLHHEDPELCIPLHVSFDMSDVNARWQSWSRALGLPLLLPAPDGTWQEPFDRIGGLMIKPAVRRQPRKMLAKRKSCMSAFREKVAPRPMPVVGGAEIIARH
jgi:hypothetical protein